jgi:hypothetical protein
MALLIKNIIIHINMLSYKSQLFIVFYSVALVLHKLVQQ